jgi:alcohol dehydrogenase class IV
LTGYLATLAKAVGLADADMEEKQAAEAIIAHIEGMNQRMGIPTTIKEIRKEDIPEMARHADKEANPIYPMAVLWDAEELEKLYYLVYEENVDEQ